MSQLVTYFVFQKKTVFVPFRFLYPECSVLIEQHSNLHNLFCLKHDICPANANCMDNLAKRVHYFFDKVEPQAELIISYFKVGDSLKAGVFDKDLQDPRFITCNKSAFSKCQNESIVHQWEPTLDFLLSGGAGPLIPVKSLIRT